MLRASIFRAATISMAAFSFVSVFAQSDPDQDLGQGGRPPQGARLTKKEHAEKYRMAPVQGMDAKTRMRGYEQRLKMEAESPFGGIKWRSVGPTSQGGRVLQIHSQESDPS